MCSVTAWRYSRLCAHWLMALVVGRGLGLGRSMYSAFPENCSVSYLSFVYGRSLWAELIGGENSLHWKASMLPLFSIMTLWSQHIYVLTTCTFMFRQVCISEPWFFETTSGMHRLPIEGWHLVSTCFNVLRTKTSKNFLHHLFINFFIELCISNYLVFYYPNSSNHFIFCSSSIVHIKM